MHTGRSRAAASSTSKTRIRARLGSQQPPMTAACSSRAHSYAKIRRGRLGRSEVSEGGLRVIRRWCGRVPARGRPVRARATRAPWRGWRPSPPPEDDRRPVAAQTLVQTARGTRVGVQNLVPQVSNDRPRLNQRRNRKPSSKLVNCRFRPDYVSCEHGHLEHLVVIVIYARKIAPRQSVARRGAGRKCSSTRHDIRARPRARAETRACSGERSGSASVLGTRAASAGTCDHRSAMPPGEPSSVTPLAYSDDERHAG
eukprot:681837-Pleurochrysis_carterae.AAC.2